MSAWNGSRRRGRPTYGGVTTRAGVHRPSLRSEGKRWCWNARTAPLCEAYDLAMLDLDGVVYIGADAVPGAPAHVDRARAAGMRVAFITNNALRPPAAVADAPARARRRRPRRHDVVTSAQAAARVLVERLGPGARVVLLGAAGPGGGAARGGPGAGGATDDAEAVVTGYGPDVRWRRHDAGRGPGARRSVVGGEQHRHDDPDGVRRSRPATACRSTCCDGSPGWSPWWPGSRPGRCWTRPMRRVGGERPLMVGDRLDTDIEGAHERRRRLAARADRGDRAARAGGGPARRSARRTCRPTWRACRGRTRRSGPPDGDGDLRAAGRRAVDGRPARRGRRGRGRRLVAGGGAGALGARGPRRAACRRPRA